MGKVSGNLYSVRKQFWVLAVVCGLGFAQEAKQQKKEAPPPEKKKEEPASLFTGKLGVRSSQKTKESATFGFNGIDPSGKVDQAMLAKSAGSEEQGKVKKMAELAPTPADLDAFIKEGGLKKK
jgi:hypothetical protein